MKSQRSLLTTILVFALLSSSLVHGQQKPTATVIPAEKLPDGWEEIDERLLFLMVRLANVEASLDAIEKAIGSSTRKKAAKTGEGKRAEAGNDRMDRKGGGPMKWSEFYGTTAEKFFYHPTDRNTTYHTTTVLNQRGPQADNKVGGGVPAGQGVPVHQRPPQFDYIYRANEKAKERAEAEATALKGKIEQLAQRRQRLEAEQAGLWCEIAFRAVSHYDLDKKPLYRFQPIAGNDTESRRNSESMKDAASFMALALSVMSATEKDQAATFSKIKPAVAEARQRLNDGWLELGVDVTDRYTTEGRFAALAKRLDDVASNLSDSYLVAMEGDQAKDQQRKDTFRALLQESLVKYAQIVLALDEMSTVMKNDWKITLDVERPIHFVSLTDVVGVQPSVLVPSQSIPASEAADTPPSQPSSNSAPSRGKTGMLKTNGAADGRFDILWEGGWGFILEVKEGNVLLLGDIVPDKGYSLWPTPVTMPYNFDAKTKTASADREVPNSVPIHFQWNVATGEASRIHPGTKQLESGRVRSVKGANVPEKTLVELIIHRDGGLVHHQVNHRGSKLTIIRTDGSETELVEKDGVLTMTTVHGTTFSFNLNNRKTSSGEPIGVIYK